MYVEGGQFPKKQWSRCTGNDLEERRRSLEMWLRNALRLQDSTHARRRTAITLLRSFLKVVALPQAAEVAAPTTQVIQASLVHLSQPLLNHQGAAVAAPTTQVIQGHLIPPAAAAAASATQVIQARSAVATGAPSSAQQVPTVVGFVQPPGASSAVRPNVAAAKGTSVECPAGTTSSSSSQRGTAAGSPCEYNDALEHWYPASITRVHDNGTVDVLCHDSYFGGEKRVYNVAPHKIRGATSVVSVQLPASAAPGDELKVMVPDGRELVLTVPAGAQAGKQLRVVLDVLSGTLVAL